MHKLKFIDTEVVKQDLRTDISLSNQSGPFGSLLPIPLGTGESERMTSKVRVKEVHIKGTLRISSWNPILPVQNARDNPSVRVELVLDRFNGNAVGTLVEDEIWLEPTNTVNTTNAFRNMDFAAKYKILASYLADLHVPVQAITAEADTSHAVGRNWHFQIHVKTDFVTEYNFDNTLPILNSRLQTNNLRLCAWANNEEADATISMLIRVKYHDEDI